MQRLSIAGISIDNLVRFVLNNDGREFIYYFTRSFDGGLVAQRNHSMRIVNLLIRIGQYEEVARHATNHNAVAQMKRASAGREFCRGSS